MEGSKESQPQNVSFDNFHNSSSVSDMHTEWRDVCVNPEIALSPTRSEYIQKLPFSKDDVRAVRGGEQKAIADTIPRYMEDLDQRWMEYGVKFLDKVAKNGKPFLLYYGTRDCHFDSYPSARYAGSSSARTSYGDRMVKIGDIFANLYKALEKNGRLDNTLIMFTSNNGPEAEVPPYGRAPFRGAKGSVQEGGVRVPIFVYWKGMVQPCKPDGVVGLADLFPTALDLAGRPGAKVANSVPKTTFIDGVGRTSLFLGTNSQSNCKAEHYFLSGKLSTVHMDEFEYHALIQQPYAYAQGGHQGGFTDTIMQTAGSSVFNLYTGPQENNSISVRHIPMGAPLQAEMHAYMEILKKYPSHAQIRSD